MVSSYLRTSIKVRNQCPSISWTHILLRIRLSLPYPYISIHTISHYAVVSTTLYIVSKSLQTAFTVQPLSRICVIFPRSIAGSHQKRSTLLHVTFLSLIKILLPSPGPFGSLDYSRTSIIHSCENRAGQWWIITVDGIIFTYTWRNKCRPLRKLIYVLCTLCSWRLTMDVGETQPHGGSSKVSTVVNPYPAFIHGI